MSSSDGSILAAAWEHVLEPLAPAEVAPLQRRYVASLPVPTFTDLDLRLRDGIRAVGVKVGTEPVAFALVQGAAGFGLPSPLLVGLAAPGQSSADLRRFFQEVARTEGIQGVWGRSDDALLLEVLMLEGWGFRGMGALLVVEALAAGPEVGAVELRHLDPSDLELAAALYDRIPPEEGGPSDRNLLRKNLQDRVLDGLLEDGELRAVVQLLPQYHPLYVSLAVTVDPAHRRKGYARLLASDAAAEELTAGRQVIAAIDAGDVVSRRLVEAIGARVVATYFLATPPGGSSMQR